MRYLLEENIQSAVMGINETSSNAEKFEAKFKDGMPSKFLWDGKKLTNILVCAALNDQEDFDDLIDFLKVHKHCFAKTF